MNQLLHGDCLELMKDIPAGSIDMILCDLPYGTTVCKWDTIIPFEPLWEQYNRVIKKNGAIVLFSAEPFTSSLIQSNIKGFKYDLIWHKKHPKGHLNAKKMPMRAHENICVFYKKLPVYNFIKTTGHPRKVATTNNYQKKDESVYGKQKNIDRSYDSTERYPISILTFNNENQSNRLHPTQKPVALCEYLIKTYTDPGELILDNCAGSGTTAIAAMQTGRNYICMEKEEKYFKIAQERINQYLEI